MQNIFLLVQISSNKQNKKGVSLSRLGEDNQKFGFLPYIESHMSERFKMCKWQMCIEENNYFIYPTSDS
jgi:hypothetical protein